MTRLRIGCDCGCGILDPDCLKPLTGENDGVYCYSDSSLRERSDKACNAVTAECEEVSGGNNEVSIFYARSANTLCHKSIIDYSLSYYRWMDLSDETLRHQ